MIRSDVFTLHVNAQAIANCQYARNGKKPPSLGTTHFLEPTWHWAARSCSMSVLVALKMEGRFAGAILTVVSLVDVTTGERCQDSGRREWDIFFWAASCSRRSSAILAHKFNFVECPARVCNWRPEPPGRHQLLLPSPRFSPGEERSFSRCFTVRGHPQDADAG